MLWESNLEKWAREEDYNLNVLCDLIPMGLADEVWGSFKRVRDNLSSVVYLLLEDRSPIYWILV
jgi:hypothetical protein